MGEDWINKQKGAWRKTEIFTYFYEIYVFAYENARENEGMSQPSSREIAKGKCVEMINQMKSHGLPSVRHKKIGRVTFLIFTSLLYEFLNKMLNSEKNL
ncbi:hypothetical protein A9Q83_08225 [Alphaproteobacteria bacterium 46_93_T64]|nr:hypothetical protein A9Q83_08225 [Alphaproteobacteria bacterium 46_93_T64]